MGKRKKTKYAPPTASELAELRKLEKRANKRISRMTPEMKEAIFEYRKGERFSIKNPASRGEYAARMAEVEKFLSSKITTKTGWKQLKKSALDRSVETLRMRRHYDLTDEEFANIFKEIKKKSALQFYKTLDIVQAKKYNAEAKGDIFDNKALEDAITSALKSHISFKEAIRKKTKARKRKENSLSVREELDME